MKLAAAIQMASGPKVSPNLNEAKRLIASAAETGAGLIVLPENFALMPMKEGDRLEIVEREGEGPIQKFLGEQARKHGVWLVGGTIPLMAEDRKKVRAACLVFNDKGDVVGRYDKMHLFDVSLENGEKYNESFSQEPGNQPVVVDTPFGRLGLAVCYDLRFPELFRRMLDQGAELFAVPSAFTEITGKAHWEVLVRARDCRGTGWLPREWQGDPWRQHDRQSLGQDNRSLTPRFRFRNCRYRPPANDFDPK